jgi:hypothetical protein
MITDERRKEMQREMGFGISLEKRWENRVTGFPILGDFNP